MTKNLQGALCQEKHDGKAFNKQVPAVNHKSRWKDFQDEM